MPDFEPTEKERSVHDAILADVPTSHGRRIVLFHTGHIVSWISNGGKEESIYACSSFREHWVTAREACTQAVKTIIHADGVSSIESNAIRPVTFL